ncbi:hypothetical protein EON67_03520, partial [archaeon]
MRRWGAYHLHPSCSDLIDAKRILREIKLMRFFGEHENLYVTAACALACCAARAQRVSVPLSRARARAARVWHNAWREHRARREGCRVTLYDMEEPMGPTGFEDVYLITELMETDLHRIIYSKQKLTDEHVAYFVYQILRALKYMH